LLLIEKAAVRTSTDATLLLPTIAPSNHMPGRRVSVENQIRTMRGGALGFAIVAFGSVGGLLETTRFGGTPTGFGEHAATQHNNAPATHL
jgi:hypothetical protein